jgi:hypothetical protein
LGFARNVRLRTFLDCLKYNFNALIPRYVFEPFQAVEITIISKRTMSPATRIEIEKRLRDRLSGKEVVVHHDLRNHL